MWSRPLSAVLISIITLYTTLIISIVNIKQVASYEIPKFIGQSLKGIKSGIDTVGSVVPDPQDALTFLPRKLTDTKTKLDKNLVSQNVNDVRFYLYEDKQNPEAYTEIKIGDQESVFESTLFDHKKPVKILIHGFQQNFESQFPQMTKDAYLEYTDYNIICVDWGALATPRARHIAAVLYPLVVDNVSRVGERVGDFIVYLRANDFISTLNLVHIIGFSLGAHVAAIAGDSVKRRMGGYKVGRITGLDPAGPKFLTAHRERRLDMEDARMNENEVYRIKMRKPEVLIFTWDSWEWDLMNFVDVIHTSQLGYMTQIGHCDMFPNGGVKQPHCVDPEFGVVNTISSLGSAITGTCSHTRAAQYFTKSINESIYACKCNSWVDFEVSCRSSCGMMVAFGEDCPSTARGKYYLDISL